MNSTLPKTRHDVRTKSKKSPPPLPFPWTPKPEECFIQFAQSLKNIGEIPIHWLNTFRIQSSDMNLARTLRVGGEKGLVCVVRTSPRLENFLQENASPLSRVGGALFDRLAVEFTQRMARLCLGTALIEAPEIQPGIPKEFQNQEPDAVCKVLVDVTFVEIQLFRKPLTLR